MRQLICLFALFAAGGHAQSMPTMMIDMRPGDTHLAGNPAAARFRWLTLDTASLSTRYRWADTAGGAALWNQQQHQVALRGTVAAGVLHGLRLHFGLFTGSGFQAGWNNTGPGTGRVRTNLYLKQLSLEAQPWRGVAIEAGGLDLLRGQASEVTSLDADGYVVGQRIRVRRRDRLFFDEVSFVNGYLGDLRRSSVVPRLGRFARSNYRQVLVTRQVHERIVASAEYAAEGGTRTFRQAVSLRTSGAAWIDSLRFEQSQAAGAGYGVAIYGEKRLRPWLAAGTGVARHGAAGLYSDRFGRGRHWFGNLLVTPGPRWSLMVQMTQTLGGAPRTAQGTRVDVVLGYNLRGLKL